MARQGSKGQRNVLLRGAGRIGRMFLIDSESRPDLGIRVAAIHDRIATEALSEQIACESLGKQFRISLASNGNCGIIVNGRFIPHFYTTSQSDMHLESTEAVVDTTGDTTSRNVEMYLRPANSAVKKIVLAGPSRDIYGSNIKTVVIGANEAGGLSRAAATPGRYVTNAVAGLVAVISANFRIKRVAVSQIRYSSPLPMENLDDRLGLDRHVNPFSHELHLVVPSVPDCCISELDTSANPETTSCSLEITLDLPAGGRIDTSRLNRMLKEITRYERVKGGLKGIVGYVSSQADEAMLANGYSAVIEGSNSRMTRNTMNIGIKYNYRGYAARLVDLCSAMLR